MWRSLLLGLAILAVVYIEYEIYPGHSFLQGETQIYVPVLERLDSPGFLVRDLVATHPQVTYTIYDEATLFLHKATGLSLERSLEWQQFLFRVAAATGIYMLVLSTRVNRLLALTLTSIVCLGALLPGPAAAFPDREPVPREFAFGLVLLAAGWLVTEKPLLSGLSGGLALAYCPSIASVFWVPVALGYVFDRRLRPLFRPSLTVLLVFILLLANLAQLQPGIAEAQPFFRPISRSWEAVQKRTAGTAWVSLWAGQQIWHYLAIWVCGLWATARIWTKLNLQTRYFLLILPLLGVLSVPASWLFLEGLRWPIAAQVQPARALLYTVSFSAVTCAIAGLWAVQELRLREAASWFFLLFANTLSEGVLNVLRITGLRHLLEFCAAGLLACGLAFLIHQFLQHKSPLIFVAPLVAVLCSFLMNGVGSAGTTESIAEVAAWAESSTWGSSMFLFPDAQRALYPGVFRARSRRALYVDWGGRGVSTIFESFATEWWKRWGQTMAGSFRAGKLQDMLEYPIDYYVLKRANMLRTVRPVFATREYLVYDAQDLRNAPADLD
jgi:hypothetical protein